MNGIKVDNLPIKDKFPTEPSDLKKMAPISEIKTDTKPEPELNLTTADYINQAKKVFYQLQMVGLTIPQLTLLAL